MSRFPRHLSWVIKAIVSAGLIAWLVSSAGLADVKRSLADVHPWRLALAASLNLIGPILMTFRWRLLLRARGVHAPYGELLRSVVVASFFVRQFLPTTIGGDLLRVYDAWRLGASRSVALVSVGVDRFCGMATMLLFAVIAGGTAHRLLDRWPLQLGGVLLAAAVGLAIVVLGVLTPAAGWIDHIVARGGRYLPSRVLSKFLSLWRAMVTYRGDRRVLAGALLWSMALQFNVVLYYALLGWSLGLPIGLGEYLLIVPLAWLIMLLPVSINGVGVREGIFVVLLGACGASQSAAIAFAWLDYGILLVLGVLGGLLFLVGGRKLPSRELLSGARDEPDPTYIDTETSLPVTND